MSIYPTLEDMKVDHYMQASAPTAPEDHHHQHQNFHPNHFHSPAPSYNSYGASQPVSTVNKNVSLNELYPQIDDFMGLSLSNLPVANLPQNNQVAHREMGNNQNWVAPVTGVNNMGLKRSEISQGIRRVVLVKVPNAKIGIKVKSINQGIFVSFVAANSLAALGGLRFGDQILSLNDETVAGWFSGRFEKEVKKAPKDIVLAVRDRPFERTITMHKDSTDKMGFMFNKNKITHVVKDSSAARNGLLIEHHMVEVNGKNVLGLKEKQIAEIIDSSDKTVTITIIPSIIYNHIIKKLSVSFIKNEMNREIPDI